MYRFSAWACVLCCGALVFGAVGEEPVDLEAVTAIRHEGFHHSQVMATLQQLTDVFGARLTNSPQQRRSALWARQQLADWGLSHAQLEPWGEFGRGWSFDRASVHMIRPHQMPLMALPKAWTPGTAGYVRGMAMRADITKKEDFEKYAGKISGKMLLLDRARTVRTDDRPVLTRHSHDDLCNIEEFPIPGQRSPDWRADAIRRWEFRKAFADFLVEEGVVALLELSSRDAGVIRVMGNPSYEAGENPGPPTLAMATEHYNAIVRMLEEEEEVELEINVTARFHEEDPVAHNVIAEIPGTSKRQEVVMVGAHLDSWHTGTGATDNAAGCAVAMEAVRILKSLDLKPKRTIRIALWTGEEQGLLGSRGYVERHFASRPEHTDPEQLALPARFREELWPMRTTREHDRFSVYFNLDNGSGKIRGIYAQENAAVKPIFEAWLRPFADLGATTVTLRNTGSTDHVPFDAVGLPGFQFIQDPLEYFPRTHHTNLDVFDRLREDDMKQASVVMASFVYHAAMRDDLLPRKPMPREPEKTKEAKEEDGN